MLFNIAVVLVLGLGALSSLRFSCSCNVIRRGRFEPPQSWRGLEACQCSSHVLNPPLPGKRIVSLSGKRWVILGLHFQVISTATAKADRELRRDRLAPRSLGVVPHAATTKVRPAHLRTVGGG
jgi:hypothetical protein